MQYYIHKNGRSIGPVDDAVVRSGVETGAFSPKDPACVVGESQWRTVGEILYSPRGATSPSNAASDDFSRRQGIRSAAPSRSAWTASGRSSLTITTSGAPPPPSDHFIGRVAEQISTAAGLERIEGITFQSMFAEVFRKRSDEELESYFSVGAPETTPRLDTIKVRWPQPWAFVRILAIILLAFASSYFMAAHFHNGNAIPAVLMFGALAIPSAVLVLFFEFNILKNVSVYQITKLGLVGGGLSLVVSLFLFGWAHEVGLDFLGAAQAGIVEEIGKLLAMLIVVNHPRYRWTLNGLLIGAAIGTGFAVVETAGYAFRLGILHQVSSPEDVLWMRGALYVLGGHGLLSAISGAGLWMVKGGRRFEITMLGDRRFLRILAVSIGCHMLWNSSFELPFYGKYLAIGFILWIVIVSLVQSGLKQVRAAQKCGQLP